MLKILKFIAFICVAGLAAMSCSEKRDSAPDFSRLTSDNHPRIVYTDADFAAIREAVASDSNPCLTQMHNALIGFADEYVGAPDLERVLYGSDNLRRLLSVSRLAVRRLGYCAYAYKTTGDTRYLAQAEHDLVTVCGFEDWNAVEHFLDAAEMSIAVGLAYDWLYNDLSAETKALARKALDDFAFQPALYGKLHHDIFNSNWNFPCMGGLSCGALATYEDNPEVAREILDRAFESNRRRVGKSYSPDGSYLSGYMYWNSGTANEVFLLTELQTALGSDDGISETEGFSRTGKFEMYMEGATGKSFNFGDNDDKLSSCLAEWYFAWRFNDPSCLYLCRDRIRDLKAVDDVRLLPVFTWFASKVGTADIAAPAENIYYARGLSPVVLIHDTWTMDENDIFLGIKGGRGVNEHGHLDAGSFVYDAEGVRWAADFGKEDYAGAEAYLNLWDTKAGADRWTKVFRYNNFNHNTLTVNDALFDPEGMGTIPELIDSDGRRGAVVDITAPLAGEVASAVRTIFLEGKDLVVEDRVTSLPDREADVRWTLVTYAEPTVVDGGITLTKDGRTKHLTCTSSTGHEPVWHTWSTCSGNPWDSPNPNLYECGYTVTVGPGETAVLTCRMGGK